MLWSCVQPTWVLHISTPLLLMGGIESGEQKNFQQFYRSLAQFIAVFSGSGDRNPPPPPVSKLLPSLLPKLPNLPPSLPKLVQKQTHRSKEKEAFPWTIPPLQVQTENDSGG